MKAFVNFLSIFRIVAAFALVPIVMYGFHWTAFILFTVAGLSDFFDGLLAKKFNATSKLGGVLDHMGDKFLVVNSFIMLAITMQAWFIVVPIILMTARELYVSGLREFAGANKMEMPVPNPRLSMGKVKAFFQMVTIGAFFLLFAIGTSITADTTSRFVMFAITALPIIGLCGIWISLGASLYSALEYTFDFAKKFKK